MAIARPWGQPEKPQDDVMTKNYQAFGYAEIPTLLFRAQAKRVLDDVASDSINNAQIEPKEDNKEANYDAFMHSIYESTPAAIDSAELNERFLEGITVMLYDYFKGLKIFAEGLVEYMPSSFIQRFNKLLQVGVVLGKFKEQITYSHIKAFTKAAIHAEIVKLIEEKDEHEIRMIAGRLYNMTQNRRRK